MREKALERRLIKAVRDCGGLALKFVLDHPVAAILLQMGVGKSVNILTHRNAETVPLGGIVL